MICPLFSEYAFTNFDVVHLLRGTRLALCTFPVHSCSVWQRFNVPLYSTGTYLTSGIWSYLTRHGVSLIYLFFVAVHIVRRKGTVSYARASRGCVHWNNQGQDLLLSVFFVCMYELYVTILDFPQSSASSEWSFRTRSDSVLTPFNKLIADEK